MSIPNRRIAAADWSCLLILAVVTATLLVGWLAGVAVGGALVLHAALLVGYALLAQFMAAGRGAAWVLYVRAVSVVGIMFALYSTLGHLAFIAIPWSGDAVLARIDTWMFLGNSPALLAQHGLDERGLEFLSFIYGVFIPYLYMSILLGLIGRELYERERFLTGFSILYAVSFLGYLFVPARGPVIHLASEFDVALSGGFFHTLVVESIDRLGGPHGAFPSLHVGASVYLCMFDFRYNRLRGATYLPIVVLIAVATIFLRYHYVVDLVAGTLLALMATWLAAVLEERRGVEHGHLRQKGSV